MDQKLTEKLYKLPGGEEFEGEVLGLSVEQLKNRIAQMQKDLDESEEHKKDNQALADAKSEVAMIEGPYNDVKKAVKVKTKFLIELIKEKGGA
ncbi:MAG: hypothetical protein HC840_01115 [Leptolyngbyaceae cyanobacterium RM2_2_4]|nr:hypothetical protein [Leptolyngbyaceae cyanobacterium RM2_2_4]